MTEFKLKCDKRVRNGEKVHKLHYLKYAFVNHAKCVVTIYKVY